MEWLRKLMEGVINAHEKLPYLVGLVLAFVGILLMGYHEVRHVIHWLSRRFNNHQVAENGVGRIAHHFRHKKTVHIFGLYHEEPAIEVEGRVSLTSEEKAFLATLPKPKVNDPHAVLVGDPDWSVPRPELVVQSLDYREVKTLMYAGLGSDDPPRLVPLLSANAVILCRERKQLILHRRAKGIRTYESCLHTIGGGYMPPGIAPKDDSLSLKNTVIREVDEEVRANLAFDQTPPLLMIEEVDTGFIQLAFLGINISGAHCDQLPENPNAFEGKPEKVSFDQLPEDLARTDWVPAGKAAVLAWLALGAPGTGWLQRFGGRTAAKLFLEITSRPHQYGGVQAITPGASK